MKGLLQVILMSYDILSHLEHVTFTKPFEQSVDVSLEHLLSRTLMVMLVTGWSVGSKQKN